MSVSRAFRDGAVSSCLESLVAGCAGGSEPTAVTHTRSSGEWAALAPMPTARFIAGAATANGSLYVVGGRNNRIVANHSVADTTLEAYDPATDHWSTTDCRSA